MLVELKLLGAVTSGKDAEGEEGACSLTGRLAKQTCIGVGRAT